VAIVRIRRRQNLAFVSVRIREIDVVVVVWDDELYYEDEGLVEMIGEVMIVMMFMKWWLWLFLICNEGGYGVLVWRLKNDGVVW
jgi:hypothetical protein